MEKQIFFRVANIETQQGLWYDYDGEFTGLIHNEFDFCENSELPMPYNEDIRGWLSAVEDLDDLWFWFPKKDLIRLQEHGWYVYAYQAAAWKTHENHVVIKQETAIPILRIEISKDLEIGNIKQLKQAA